MLLTILYTSSLAISGIQKLAINFLEHFGKFSDECAYLHLTRDDSKEAHNEVIEDMKNLSYIREEANVGIREIKSVKFEVQQLKT